MVKDKDAECNAKTEKMARRHDRQLGNLNRKHSKEKKQMQSKHANEIKVCHLIVANIIQSTVTDPISHCLLQAAVQLANKYRAEAEAFMAKNRKLKRQFHQKVEAMELKHKAEKKALRLYYSSIVNKRRDEVARLQSLVIEMREMMHEHATEEDSKRRQLYKKLRSTERTRDQQTKRANKNMERMREWKGKYEAVVDDIMAKQNLADDLSDELEEWKRSADDMRQQYEDALHELTPTTIEKVWVKNVDKAGMYISLNCLPSTPFRSP